MPPMLRSVIHMDILENLVPIDDILWLKVAFRINGVAIAQREWVVVQRSPEGLP